MGPASSFVNGGLDVAELAPVKLQQFVLYASSSKDLYTSPGSQALMRYQPERTYLSSVYRLYGPHCTSSNRRVSITSSHPSPAYGSRTIGNHLGAGTTTLALR